MEKKIEKIKAIIYQPAKAATQSKSKHRSWTIRMANENVRFIEPLMGWTGTTDMLTQLNSLFFDDVEDAVVFCEKKNWEYEVEEPHFATVKKKSYSENFTRSVKP